MSATTAGGNRVAEPTGRSWRPHGKTIFLAVVLVVLAIYTQMAFDMEWRTQAGRIGPGFFPRFIGGLAILATLIALVKSLRDPSTDEDEVDLLGEEEAGDADLGRHPKVLALLVLASAVLVAVFTTLGAIIACAVFLLGTLWFLNRPHPIVNLAVSIGLPVIIYVLFQSLLNAGLPNGILPRF